MLSPALLDGVRAEIAEHEAALAKLRDIERLTLELTPVAATSAAAPASSSPAPAPPRARSAAARRPTLRQIKERKQAIMAVLSTQGPLSPRAIAEAIGEEPDTIRAALRQMAEGSQLVARGATSTRTYDIARNGTAAAAPREVSPRVRRELERAATPAPEPELEDRVVEILQRAGGRVALSEIEDQLRRKQVSFDRGELERAASRLTTHGLVERDPGGGLRLGERPVEAAALDAAGVESI